MKQIMGKILRVLFFVVFICTPFFAFAEVNLKQEIDSLNGQMKEREGRLQDLNQSIQRYKTRIKEQESARASLQNQVALLENRIEEKQLAVLRTKEEIQITNLQIARLQNQIVLEEQTIERRQTALGELVRELDDADRVGLVDVFLSKPTLSDFLMRIEALRAIQRDLVDATRDVRESKNVLEGEKSEADTRRAELQARKQKLECEERELETDRGAKLSLVSVTQNKEEEFARIMYELRQEQQDEAERIADLRDSLKGKLDSVDEALARGDILLNWPIIVAQGVSARFHDPDYPFRRFFEHPGIDTPTPVGTPIRASAGGYVAWNKTGKQYGNYVMLIHPGGIATVYAHLSRFVAKADTYVERGDIIGYSGGRPGDTGAGLSTGPHVHFEVRQNCIPVNPENFLPSLD